MTESIEQQHERAMQLADEGLYLRRRGEHEEAFAKFVEAAVLESQVADSMSAELQPGHGVIHRSAATLALDANQVSEASRLIEQALQAHPVPAIRAELEELGRAVAVLEDMTRIAPNPWPLLHQILVGLSYSFSEMIIEVAETGQLIDRVAGLQLRKQTELFVYPAHKDFDAWKALGDASAALPPRIRLFVVEGYRPGGYSKVKAEVYGSVPSGLLQTIEGMFDGPASLFPFIALPERSKVA